MKKDTAPGRALRPTARMMHRPEARGLAALLCAMMALQGCPSIDGEDDAPIASSPSPVVTPPLASTPIVVPTDEVTYGRTTGGLDGRLEVTADGAASYRVPLWVPDGRAGMQPHLALTYHNRGQAGLLGVGWSISGFPRITRCAKTLATDGQARTVRFDASDSFCYEGAKLVLVSAASGSTPAVYRTEVDGFAKFEALAPDALGPTQFRTVPATAEEIAAEAWKFTTRNEGASIRVRGGL